ncbi:carboxypeptidase-like regulatory domain-containing protein [Lewinella sp. LCG006]|uniref:TonB-dependent receptor n=1 Tax=Lewinella sp. LCG006 TaxID=3231911 RepID=UPI0034610140
MRYFYLLLISQMALLATGASQTIFTGKVQDKKGEPIIGANVYLVGSYDGTVTNEKGYFEFTTTETGSWSLAITYLGYDKWESTVVANNQPQQFQVTLLEGANQLDAVVITAGAFAAGDGKKSVTLNTLDIVTTAGASGDVIGALQTLPGAQRVGENGRLFVRGGAAYETKTFIDGAYVAQPYTSTVPNVPARGRFSPLLFQGTTFSTGGYSAAYGQALSSALILSSEDLAPHTLTGISLMSVGGSLSHTQRWENTSVAVSADYTNLEPYLHLVPQDIQWDKAPKTAGGQLIMRHQTRSGGLLKLQAQHHRSSMALRTPSPLQVTDTIAVGLENDYTYTGLGYQTMLGNQWSLKTTLAYTRHEDRTTTIANIKEQQQSWTANAQLSTEIQTGHLLRMGLNYIDEHWAEQLEIAAFSADQRIQEPLLAAYIEDDWSVTNKLITRLGTRMEYRSTTQEWSLSPRLSLAYKTGTYSQVSIAGGRFVQTPTEQRLFANPNLQSEEALHLLANWQWQKAGRTLRVEAYEKSYRQLVLQQEATFTNEGGGYARGIDVFYRDKLSLKNSDFWVSYAYLDTERRFDQFTDPVQPNFAAKHTLNIVYKYWVPRWQSMIGLTGVWASPRNYFHPEGTAVAGRTSPFKDLSLNWSYLTQIKGHFTVLHLSFSNVPGFINHFGEQFSQQPAADGTYPAITVRPPAKRFAFVGLFVSIGEEGASLY